MSGVNVQYAVEADPHAALTFRRNHPGVNLLEDDITNVIAARDMPLLGQQTKIVFGGPPCQGFSTSNQKNRSSANPNNWLFEEYLRLVEEITPEWIVFENVKGLIETENGYFLEQVLKGIESKGFTTSHFILNSADFGVPQRRNRLFIVGSRRGKKINAPSPTVKKYVSVREALHDLPDLQNGDSRDLEYYRSPPSSTYASKLRGGKRKCWNNLVTKNAEHILHRYSHIPQGGNWADIPSSLMTNYSDVTRCHTGIYRRLKDDEPSIVIGNFRKNMLIHPWVDRGLSVREAARLQSFPDAFRFYGSIGFQQQQVGNAVPPLLAKALFDVIMDA